MADRQEEKSMAFNREVAPVRLFQRILGGWVWIVLGGIVGGALGSGTSFLRPPRYETEAMISVRFDYARVEEMDDPVTSYVTQKVRDLLLSDQTIQAAVDMLHTSGSGAMDLPADIRQFRKRISLADENGRWHLAGQGGSPEEAAAVADAWAEVSLDALDQAMIHAIRASELQTAIYRAGCRLIEAPASPGEAIWSCETPDQATRPEDLPEALLTEANLSHGLLPAMSFSLLERAQPPEDPVLWGRGGLILAGTLLGMWIAVLGIVFRRGRENAAEPAGPSMRENE